jgi:hypothetical protein
MRNFIITTIKPERMRWKHHVANMGKTGNMYSMLVGREEIS